MEEHEDPVNLLLSEVVGSEIVDEVSNSKVNIDKFICYLDTGATRHIVNDENLFYKCKVNIDKFICYLYTGATRHIVNDENLFYKYVNLRSPIKVNVAKNQTEVLATKLGNVKC